MRKITYLFILFVCINLMSMDQQPAQTHIGTMLQAGPLIATIITNDPLLLDHDTICSFALASKYYNKRILETVPQRKEFLTKYDNTAILNTTVFCGRDMSRRLWHRYGSSYAVAEMLTHKNGGKKTLYLFYRYLAGHGKMSSACCPFENFSSFLDENPTPFFNENGVLSFYGYGIVEVGRAFQSCLMRYDLDTTALLSSCFPCFLRVRNENGAIISETHLTRSNLCFLLQNNKVSLNSLSATKEERKRYSYFGESSEECIIIDLIENSVATMDKKKEQ